MPQNARRQARAIAIAKAEDTRLQKMALFALAVSMATACIYGLLALAT